MPEHCFELLEVFGDRSGGKHRFGQPRIERDFGESVHRGGDRMFYLEDFGEIICRGSAYIARAFYDSAERVREQKRAQNAPRGYYPRKVVHIPPLYMPFQFAYKVFHSALQVCTK